MIVDQQFRSRSKSDAFRQRSVSRCSSRLQSKIDLEDDCGTEELSDTSDISDLEHDENYNAPAVKVVFT